MEAVPTVSYQNIPLHFELNDKPFFVLDHRSSNNSSHSNRQSANSFYQPKRPGSRQKIFEKRKCKSLRSGLMSTTDPYHQRDSINSEGRNKKGKIFKNSNPVSIRDYKSLTVNDNMRELISFNNTPKADRSHRVGKNITISYESPEKYKNFVRSPERPVSVRPVSHLQNWAQSYPQAPLERTPHQDFTMIRSPPVVKE